MRKPRVFLKGKTSLIILFIAVIATVLIVFISGLSSHRTVLENSLISLSILTTLFFFFLAIGLYKGLHIHDNLSHKLKWGKSRPTLLTDAPFDVDVPDTIDAGDGIEGILLATMAWIVMAILFILLIILLEFVLWAGVLALAGLVYWVLIQALKLIFSKSADCEGDLPKSLMYASGYTLLYVGWIYGVIYISTLF